MSQFENLPEDIKTSITKVNPEGVDLYDIETRNNMNQGKIPNINDPDVIASFNKDRSKATYTGAIQMGKLKERNELRNLLSKSEVILYLNSKNNGTIDVNDIDVINYIPNSRLAYYNKLIKQGLQTGLSLCDINTVNTVWMSTTNKNKLVKLLTTMLNKEKKDFTLMPSSRSGLKYKCDNGSVSASFYNPGYVPLNNQIQLYNPNQYNYERSKQQCGCDNEQTANDIVVTHKHMSNIIEKYLAEMNFDHDDHVLSEYFDQDTLKLIHWSRDMALTGKADFRKLAQLTQALHNAKSIVQTSYILSLSNPFKYNQEARIPSTFPMPTSAFSVTRNISLTTNASGNLSFVICPFYLGTVGTACYINNNVALNGIVSNDQYVGIDLGQAIPNPFYVRYRLVSASVRIMFTSSALTSTGFSTMSVDFDQCRAANVGVVNTFFAPYSLYSATENGFYKQTKSVANGNTMQLNYLPTDTAMQDFFNVNNLPNGFLFTGYVTGAPASSTVARLDTVFNYEAFVSPTYADYIPTGTNDNNDNIDECKMFINNCQQIKSLDPRDMQNVVPGTLLRDNKTVNLPTEPIQIVTPVAKDKLMDTIKNIGTDIITTIVDNKVKDKQITDKMEIADRIKDRINKYTDSDFNLTNNSTSGYRPDKSNLIGSIAGMLGSSVLGAILGFIPKALPALI